MFPRSHGNISFLQNASRKAIAVVVIIIIIIIAYLEQEYGIMTKVLPTHNLLHRFLIWNLHHFLLWNLHHFLFWNLHQFLGQVFFLILALLKSQKEGRKEGRVKGESTW
jgi:uncharacterized membrane protein (DUF106 family)